jgi:MSHA biogenesis protein MshQ
LARVASLCGLFLACLLAPCVARAASDNFNGAAVSNCTYDNPSKTYSCSALSTSNDITIASGYTVVLAGSIDFDYNQQLNMSGSARLQTTGALDIGDIKPSNLNISGGTLVAGTSFKIGAQAQTIVADVTAASMTIGTGSATKITGTLSATGAINLASHATIVGPISGATIATNSPVSLTGNVTATNSFQLASGSTLSGNLTAPVVTLDPSSVTVTGAIAAATSLSIGSGNTVTGNVSGGALSMASSNVTINGNVTMTGDVSIGSSGTINGDLTARNVTTNSSGDSINGNAAVNSIFLDYGAVVSKTITCTGSGGSGCNCVTKASSYNYAPSCGAAPPSGPDHFQITHNGTALTCQPQTVTVTACANASCTAPHYSAATQVTLSPGGQVATISGSGTASVQQFTAGNATLSASAAGVAKASTCVNAAAGNTSCAMAFSTQGLTVSVPDHLSMASGITLVVQALQAQGNNQSCVPLLKNVTAPVAFGCSYTDPVNAAATPVQIQGQGGGYTSVACGAATSNVNLSFDSNGMASTSFQYPEVGKVGLNASYTGSASPNTGFTATGSTSFTAAPARIKIGVLRVNNLTPLGPGVFANASAPFTVTLSAVNTAGNVTTNFGKESTPENFKPTSSIPTTNPYGAITSGLFGPIVNGVSTSVSGASGQWAYSDVGYITIASTLTNVTSNYMGNPAAGFNTQGTATVGRFIPDHFDVLLPPKAVAPAAPVWGELPSSQNAGVAMRCAQVGGLNNPCPSPYDVSGSFIYSKQPFYVLVKAYNGAATPALTQNYSSAPPSPATAYAKAITLSAWTAAGGSSAWPAGTVVNTNTAVTPQTTSVTFDKGVGMMTAALPNLTFTATPTAPSLAYVRAVDADLVTSARASPATSTELPLTVVSGRLQLGNNYGSETSSMPLTVQAQYYSAAAGAYVFNAAYTADAQGIGASPAISYANCRNGSGAAIACPAFTVKNPGTLTFSNGKASFLLAAPNTAVSTDVTLNPASWSNLYLPLPTTARATFGVYRSGPVIYTREVHN